MQHHKSKVLMDPPNARQNHPTSQEAQSSPLHDEDCAFCQIITAYPVTSPLDPSFATSEALSPERLYPPAFVLLSTEHVVAFLDIFPLVRGHVLLCPRRHAEKIGDMTGAEGMEIGRILPLLSRAVVRATMPDIPHAEVDYNVVQNNGPGAAQVVPHTHFHIIPRYPFDSTYQAYTSSSNGNSSASTSSQHVSTQANQPRPMPQGIQATAILFVRGQLHYRDDEDAEGLIIEMRKRVAEEWRKEFAPEDAATPTATAKGNHNEQRGELQAGEQEDMERDPEAAGAVRRNKTVHETEEPVRLSPAVDTRSGGGGGGARSRGGGRGRGNL